MGLSTAFFLAFSTFSFADFFFNFCYSRSYLFLFLEGSLSPSLVACPFRPMVAYNVAPPFCNPFFLLHVESYWPFGASHPGHYCGSPVRLLFSFPWCWYWTELMVDSLQNPVAPYSG